jgi:drug/metabolite transporter, DME family
MSRSDVSTEHDHARLGAWLVLSAAILWGTTGTTQALAPQGASPLTVGFVRIALGTVVLTLIAAHHNHLDSLRQWRTWPLKTTLIASGAIAAYQLFFFAGVARTGVAIGTVVGIGSTPIAAGVFTTVFYRTFPERKWIFSTFLALVGCTLLILAGGNYRVNAVGILLAMAAGASYALYTLASKLLLGTHQRGAVLAVTFALGTLLLVPVSAGRDFSWLLSTRGVLVALQLGIVTVGIAYQLYAKGLHLIAVNTVATLTLAEPLTAGLLGIFLLGETLSTADIAGIILIFAGLFLLVRKPSVRGVGIEKEPVA